MYISVKSIQYYMILEKTGKRRNYERIYNIYR